MIKLFIIWTQNILIRSEEVTVVEFLTQGFVWFITHSSPTNAREEILRNEIKQRPRQPRLQGISFQMAEKRETLGTRLHLCRLGILTKESSARFVQFDCKPMGCQLLDIDV